MQLGVYLSHGGFSFSLCYFYFSLLCNKSRNLLGEQLKTSSFFHALKEVGTSLFLLIRGLCASYHRKEIERIECRRCAVCRDRRRTPPQPSKYFIRCLPEGHYHVCAQHHLFPSSKNDLGELAHETDEFLRNKEQACEGIYPVDPMQYDGLRGP